MEIIAISVDPRPQAEAMVDEYDLKYPVLYDTNTVVSRSWNVFDLLGDGVSAPATFVFAPAGHLVAGHIGRHAGDRPDADDILKVARDFMSGPAPTFVENVVRPTATPEPTPTPEPEDTPEPEATEAPEPEETTAPPITFADDVDLAPDFTLPNAHGGDVTLSQYRDDKNVVLVFYRAFW